MGRVLALVRADGVIGGGDILACHPRGTERALQIVEMGARPLETLAEPTAPPVVVWHLRRMPDQALWCLATKVGHLYALTVCRDTSPRARPMRERFADIASLVTRAEQVKEEFLAMGWREPVAQG